MRERHFVPGLPLTDRATSISRFSGRLDWPPIVVLGKKKTGCTLCDECVAEPVSVPNFVTPQFRPGVHVYSVVKKLFDGNDSRRFWISKNRILKLVSYRTWKKIVISIKDPENVAIKYRDRSQL